MGAITQANIKFYNCSNTTAGSTYGGAINLSSQIVVDVALTGTATFSGSSATVTGSGTSFTSALAVGDYIYNYADANTYAQRVIAITNDTSLTLAANYGGTAGSGQTAHRIPKNAFFGDVPDSERQSGGTDNFKFFVYNGNADAVPLKACVPVNYSSPNEAVALAIGTSGGTLSSEGSGLTYVAPTTLSAGNAPVLGMIASGASVAIWLQRIVTPGPNGYIDSFVLQFGMY